MAISTASASNRLTTAAMSRRVPATGTPMMRSVRFAGSSSSSATGMYGLPGLRSIARTTCVAPSPAPITTTRLPCSGEGRSRWSWASRTAYRTAAASTSEIMPAAMMDERGASRPSSVSERNTSTVVTAAVRASAGISSNDPYAQRPVYRPNQMPTSVCQTIATGVSSSSPCRSTSAMCPSCRSRVATNSAVASAAASAAARAPRCGSAWRRVEVRVPGRRHRGSSAASPGTAGRTPIDPSRTRSLQRRHARERKASAGNAFPPPVVNLIARRYEIELARDRRSATVPIVMPYASIFHVARSNSREASPPAVVRCAIVAERKLNNRQNGHCAVR
jgi:hypothetical protein